MNAPQSISNEKSIWDQTAEMHGGFSVAFSAKTSQQFLSDPNAFIHLLARYKFAAKMAGKKGRLLEIACGAGIGAPILAEFAQSYLGIDTDASEIHSALHNWTSPKFCFECIDFLHRKIDVFDSIISLQQTPPQEENFFRFLDAALKNLQPTGILFLGYTQFPSPSIKQSLEKAFQHTFCFSMFHGHLAATHQENASDYFYLSLHRK